MPPDTFSSKSPDHLPSSPKKSPTPKPTHTPLPPSQKHHHAESQHQDHLKAEVDLYVDLNADALGIPAHDLPLAKARMQDEYTFLKEAGELNDIEDYDWKAFLAGAEANHTNEHREKAETTRKTADQREEQKNIESEQAIDSYLAFIQVKRQEGFDGRAIINLLLDPNVEKGFEVPTEYVGQLEQFREMLALNLGDDIGQIENLVTVAISQRQPVHTVAEQIFASHTISEATKATISETFFLPYITTKSDFRKASLDLQDHYDALTSSRGQLREQAHHLATTLETIETEMAALENKNGSGSRLTAKEAQRLQDLQAKREALKRQQQENREQRVHHKAALQEMDTDPEGRPTFQYCGFDVAVDQAGHQAIFHTPYGECSIPLAWYQYSLLAGDKITKQINTFLLSTAFSEAGLTDHLFTKDTRTPLMAGFMSSASIGKAGELVTPHDIDQARDLIKVFSPDPAHSQESPDIIQQNLQKTGILNRAGNLDPGKWKQALTFIDRHKFTSQYTYQNLKDFLQTA